MKYLVISDIHGSLYYLDKILKKEKIDKIDNIILLGDLYYHGPRNPFPEGYNPQEVANTLNNYKDKIICIKGNCDAEVDEMISSFEFKDSYRTKINNKRFFFTHGHKYNIDNIPSEVDYLIYGHFHTGFIKEKDGVVCINAGSISLPKKESKNSYLLIDDEKVQLKEVDGPIIEEIKI